MMETTQEENMMETTQEETSSGTLNIADLFKTSNNSDPTSTFGRIKKFVADTLKTAADAGHKHIPVGGMVRVVIKSHPEWLENIAKVDRYRRVYNYVRNARPKGWVITRLDEVSVFVKDNA